MNNEKTIEIIFDQDGLDKYLKHYFELHKKCRKIPIESPMVRSLNKMLVITNRIVQNSHKQNYKAYAEYIVKEQGYDMVGISSCDLEVEFTFATKIRHDLDNYSGGCKEIIDGFVDVGLCNADDYFHIKSLTTTASYEKGVTKMIFTFKNCVFDLDELKELQEKDRITKEKRETTTEANKLKKKSKSTKPKIKK